MFSSHAQPLLPRSSSRLEASRRVLQSSHVRQSLNPVYNRHGPVKLGHQQLDLLRRPIGDTTDSLDTDTEDGSHSPPEGGTRLRGGKELEMVRQQNSASVLVLASSQNELTNTRLSPSPDLLRPVIPVR